MKLEFESAEELTEFLDEMGMFLLKKQEKLKHPVVNSDTMEKLVAQSAQSASVLEHFIFLAENRYGSKPKEYSDLVWLEEIIKGNIECIVGR